MTESGDEPRFYASQDSRQAWRVYDYLKPSYVAYFGGILVPGVLSKAEAMEYAERLNKIWRESHDHHPA